MVVTPIKTHKITKKDTDLLAILDKNLPKLEERSVVAVTSKIVSICEGAVIKIGEINKDDLIAQEADLYLPIEESLYGASISLKNNILIASAGIDESNGNGYYILWPKDPQESANRIREHLSNKFGLKNIGVIITDSKTTPFRWGVTGIAISHSGFAAIRDLIDKPDIFGRPMHVTKVSVMDGLAGAAVFAMGESEEQTPIAVVTDISGVDFQDRNPTKEEIDALNISMDDDMYAPILKKVNWLKGRSGLAKPDLAMRSVASLRKASRDKEQRA